MNQTNDEAEQVHAPDVKRSGPLRIGILAARDLGFAFWERRLFEKLASDPRFEISAIIVDGREPPPRKGIYSRLTNPHLPNAVIRRLTRMIDNAAMTYEPDVPAPVFEARLARTPHITVSPHRNGHVDRFAAADVERIRDLDLDILLRHGFGILKGDILDAARFGIWSFHHGDNTVNRGSPPGFWESAYSEPMTGATLQILTEELDGGNVIARCWRTTEPNAERNRRAILDLSVPLIWRELQRLADTGKVSAEVSHLYDGRLYVEPTLTQSLAYLRKRIANSIGGLRHRLDHRLGRRPLMWQLALGKEPIDTAALWRTKPIEPPADRFWADPFLIEKDGRLFCFFEEYDYPSHRAWISVGVIDGDRFDYLGRDIDTGYHMSSPFVIAHGAEIFLIPETGARKCIEIWRATDFPLAWERHTTVFEGVSVADTVLLEHAGRWWMFANIASGTEPDFCNELHVFMVDGPELREITPHPGNPVVMDAHTARNAGRPFIGDGRIFRPSQVNNLGIYGYGLNLMEITELTPTRFAERVAHQARPNFHPGIIATHHFDALGDTFVIDICRKVGGRGRWRAGTVAPVPGQSRVT
jgi:hypothetical protein